MITRDHVIAAFRMFERGGLRKPDAMTARVTEGRDGTEEIGRARGEVFASADLWAAAMADVSPADLEAAVLSRLRQPSPWWPTIGEILALIPARALAAIDDSDTIFEACVTWLRHHAFRTPAVGELDAADEGRDTAMRGALDAVGGVMAIRMMTTTDRPHVGKRYQDAYRAIRRRVGARMEGRVVARLGGPAPGRETGNAIPMRGSGFKRLGEG